ncbi:MAG: hypothetical protein J5911_02825 [Clostridia bacterium]|nr:hypothetical protein [Clostridia bacterium]
MDNRLTKKRLSNFLAYEWLLTLGVIIAAIMAMELLYTMLATRLTEGQRFKYYFDEEIAAIDAFSVYNLLGVDIGKNGKTFSYDVLSVETESLVANTDVLSMRLSLHEGDAIFTSAVEKEGAGSRAKVVVDAYSVYDYESLLASAKEYLAQFIVSGGDIYDTADYDENLIRAYFDERMKGDNRYRTEEDKEVGRQSEIGRILKLAKDVEDFEKILNCGKESLFFRYTKYAQSIVLYTEDDIYTKRYDEQVKAGKADLIYGINVAELTGGKNVSDYLKLQGNDGADGVVLELFDFSSVQYDLQFECISFVDTLVREFSDILD